MKSRDDCRNAFRWRRVLRTFRRCRWKNQRRSGQRLCSEESRWMSTPWIRHRSVLLANTSLNSSTFVDFYLFV